MRKNKVEFLDKKKNKGKDVTNLVQKAKEGDKDAFFELVKIYKQEIFAYCYRKLGYIATNNKQEAEDASEITFIKAFQKIGKLRDVNKFRPYLYKIAKNECNNIFKRLDRYIDLDTFKENNCIDDIPDNKSASPEGDLLTKEKNQIMKDLVQRKIETLGSKWKDIIILRYYQDLHFKEIAEVLERNENTVKTWYRKGMESLTEQIKPYKEICNEVLFN